MLKLPLILGVHGHLIIATSFPVIIPSTARPGAKANGKTEQQDGYRDTNDLSCRH